jgi:hypothetical protein
LQNGTATHTTAGTMGTGSFTATGSQLSVTPAIGADNWTSGSGTSFGDDYQVLFEIFEDDGTTRYTGTKGSLSSDAYEIYEDGVKNTSWAQASPVYLPLNTDVGLKCTQSRGSAGTQANQSSPGCVVKYTIKEWDGNSVNLGTGTTVLTGTFNHSVRARTQ